MSQCQRALDDASLQELTRYKDAAWRTHHEERVPECYGILLERVSSTQEVAIKERAEAGPVLNDTCERRIRAEGKRVAIRIDRSIKSRYMRAEEEYCFGVCDGRDE